jgi:hypothetical protein
MEQKYSVLIQLLIRHLKGVVKTLEKLKDLMECNQTPKT